MDNSGIFIDAGYLLARGGLVVCGTKNRSLFDCKHEELIDALQALALRHSGLQALRLYWYDGAHDRIPTPDHLAIGGLPYVKVRLGRIGSDGKQKGVDALIYRDLMTLARERAISRAYLVAGDEDLREGVVAAQDMGVQVILIGLAGGRSPGFSQSKDLVRECDEHIVLDHEFCGKYFSGGQTDVAPAREVTEEDVEEAGRWIASEWVEQATTKEARAVAGQTMIPREIDVQLLRRASERLGVRRISPDERVRQLRAAFRAVVSEAAQSTTDELERAEFEAEATSQESGSEPTTD